ncbi:MAG: hypothetical protein Q8O82_18140 [Pseudorhodobacter sp.]|nr:hypothetical protein [Pseudorhodobacter sp.]
MPNRLQIFRVAGVLLYGGPLLAGLGGFGWPVVPVFIAIFLLWLVILRPQEWPASLADWQRPEAMVALAARAAVQLLLVALCFGIGRGIGGVLGGTPTVPVVVPIAMSLLAIPLARLVGNPAEAAELDAPLDDAAAPPADPVATDPQGTDS